MEKTQKETVIVSVDVETTGESPCTSSCVMIGVAVVKPCKNLSPETPDSEWIIEKKAWYLKQVPGREPSNRCWTSFWLGNVELWNQIQTKAIEPTEAMADFCDWYRKLTETYNCTFIARPASFDWQWLNCVYDEFGPKEKKPLPFSITCVSTIIKFLRMCGISEKDTIDPLFVNPRIQMTHFADDDALYQAYMYQRLINWAEEKLKFE